MFVSHKGYLFIARVMPRISEQVLAHLDSVEKKKSEFDTADLRKEIAAFNICRGKANFEFAMLRKHNEAHSQYPNGLDQINVNLSYLWYVGDTLCRVKH